MESSPLYTVVVIHYNQANYILNALQSVLKQDYPSIELIIADDASHDFDIPQIEDFIAKNKKENVKNVVIYSNEENLGTVQNLNKAIDIATGTYIQFFAADDELCNEHVITTFAEQLKTLQTDELCVTGQCVMMDTELKEKYYDFVDVNTAMQLNEQTARDQFHVLQEAAFYAMGASAFLREGFYQHEKFDTRYKLIEDWPFFLSQTRKGRKVRFIDIYALNHRDGGVSHNVRPTEAKYVEQYKKDILQLHEQEILPYLKELPLRKQVKILTEYDNVRELFRVQYGPSDRPSRMSIVRKNKGLYLRKCLWWYVGKKNELLVKSIKWFASAFLIWFIMVGLTPMVTTNMYMLNMLKAPSASLIENVIGWATNVVLPGVIAVSGLWCAVNVALWCAYSVKTMLRKKR